MIRKSKRFPTLPVALSRPECYPRGGSWTEIHLFTGSLLTTRMGTSLQGDTNSLLSVREAQKAFRTVLDSRPQGPVTVYQKESSGLQNGSRRCYCVPTRIRMPPLRWRHRSARQFFPPVLFPGDRVLFVVRPEPAVTVRPGCRSTRPHNPFQRP